MKKILYLLSPVLFFSLGGCLDVTEEVMLNADGTGTYVNTNNMSQAITIAKNMGQMNNDKIPAKLDTTYSLADQADSIAGITPEEKELFRKGNIHSVISMDDEKLVTILTFPFGKMSDIGTINHLTRLYAMHALKKNMPADMPGADQMPEPSSVDDYYSLKYSNDELKKEVIKEKYSKVNDDKFFQQMQQAIAMGIEVSSTYIYDLPRPAEKVEGKNAKLSDDHKKVTVKASLDDFLNDPTVYEFKVKF